MSAEKPMGDEELNLIRLDADEWSRGRMDTVAGRHRALLLTELDRLRARNRKLVEAIRSTFAAYPEYPFTVLRAALEENDDGK